MSEIRWTHPGYWKVTSALYIWDIAVGAAFTAGARRYELIGSPFHTIFQYIPGQIWGVFYLALGVLMGLASNLSRFPHVWVRVAAGLGAMSSAFFFVVMLVSDLTGGYPAYFTLAVFLSLGIIEVAVLLESESNPTMGVRR